MRKAISCAMLASIASGGAFAQSSVTFSGVVDLYTGRVQYAGQPSNTKLESGGLQTSRFSIFGKEDL
ncbi:MAG TPA: porin, partial [Nitrosospira sp.]|nr:porin [Nitrosospira sp.]